MFEEKKKSKFQNFQNNNFCLIEVDITFNIRFLSYKKSTFHRRQCVSSRQNSCTLQKRILAVGPTAYPF